MPVRSVIIGSERNDVIAGTEENRLIRGLGGDDYLTTSSLIFGIRLEGGAGNDFAVGGGARDTLRGDDGDDSLSGKAGDDLLSGGDGDDTLIGGEGNDTAIGGTGVNLFLAGTRVDLRNGHAGRDSWRGGEGDDTFRVDGFNQAGDEDYARISNFSIFDDRISLGSIATSDIQLSIQVGETRIYDRSSGTPDLLAVVSPAADGPQILRAGFLGL